MATYLPHKTLNQFNYSSTVDPHTNCVGVHPQRLTLLDLPRYYSCSSMILTDYLCVMQAGMMTPAHDTSGRRQNDNDAYMTRAYTHLTVSSTKKVCSWSTLMQFGQRVLWLRSWTFKKDGDAAAQRSVSSQFPKLTRRRQKKRCPMHASSSNSAATHIRPYDTCCELLNSDPDGLSSVDNFLFFFSVISVF